MGLPIGDGEGRWVARKIAALVTGAALLAVLAGRVWSYPSDYGPFEKGKAPRTFHVYPCTVVAAPFDKLRAPSRACRGAAHEARPPKDSSIDVTFARPGFAAAKPGYARATPGGRPGSAQVRLSGEGADGPVFMTVEDGEGARVAGPEKIADFSVRILPAFWADLNADGKEDFVIFVMAPPGALSSGRLQGRPPTVRPLKKPLSTAGLPKRTVGVRGHNPGAGGRRRGHETAVITSEQKKRLWDKVPERIFRRPPPKKEPELASAGE